MGWLDFLLDPIQQQNISPSLTPTPGGVGYTPARTVSPSQDYAPLQPMGGGAGSMYVGSPGMHNAATLNTNNPGGGGGPGELSMPTFEEWLAQNGLGDIPSGTSYSPSDVPNYSGMVSDQFDPAIAYLQKSIKRGKREGKQGAKDIEDIYEGMARGNKRMAQHISKTGDRGEERIQRLGEQLARRTSGNSERGMQRLISQNKNLGISEANDIATQDPRTTLARNQVSQTARTNMERNALDRQNSNWENYARAQSGISKMEGAAMTSDLQQNLQDLIFGLRGQIASTKSEQASAVMDAQMQEEAMKMQAAQAQDAAAMSAYSAKAGMFGNYQADQAQLAELMAGGEEGDKAPLTGWDSISKEYQNYLKQSGQSEGAPGRNTAQVMQFMQGALPAIQSQIGPGESLDQGTFLEALRKIYEQQGEYGGTQVPSDALSRVGLPIYNQYYK